jgi:thiosulfate/3-mercaptopyruvate sulfurtransferase
MPPPLGLALLLLAPCAGGRADAYPRADLLVEPARLAKPDFARKFVVLDARGRDAYRAGHVPGAVWVDAKGWEKAFHTDRDRRGWARRVGALGIDVNTPVVIYDDRDFLAAARMWWVLRYWGVKDVRLLNGGWKGWKAAGGKVERTANEPKAVEPRLEAHPGRLATKGEILDWLREKRGPQIVDTRTTGEFCGADRRAKRAGAIPGAKHLEWGDTIDRKTGRFKKPAELARLFKEAGVDLSRPAATYCQSGGRASVMAFALELMGGEGVRNYYRSWSEWGNDPDTPVVRPRK